MSRRARRRSKLGVLPAAAVHAGAAVYRGEIDGLRAIAVVSVICFHAGLRWFPGGFVGVDVFFVISGFLITRIIIDEMVKGTFTLRGFYARRARRILPALAFVLVACVPPAALLMSPAQLVDFFRMTTAVALFASNYVLAQSTGYFDGPAEERPLLHTWSLAIEEQYYLVFPLLVLALWRLGRIRLLLALLALALASLALSEFGWRYYRAQNFFFTPSRFWELLLGSICALVTGRLSARARNWPSWARDLLAGSGLAAIVAATLCFNRMTPTPGALILVPTLGTALVLLFGTSGTWTARLLALRPMVWLGLISYSLYLWHQPLLAFAKIRSLDPLPAPTLYALILLAVGLAFLTWKFVEQPARTTYRMPDSRTLYAALAGTVALALLGLGGAVATPKAKATPVPPSVLRAFAQPARAKECFDIAYGHSKDKGWICDVNPSAEAAPGFLLFGDSHGLQVLHAFEAAAQQAGRRGAFTGFSGCVPLLGVYPLNGPDQARHDCHALNDRVLAYVKDNRIKDVFLVAKWSYYTDFYNSTDYLNALGSSPSEAVSIENSRRAFRQGLANTLRAYQSLGVRVYVLEQIAQQRYAPSAVYARVWSDPVTVEKQLKYLSVSRAEHRKLQSYVAQVFHELKAQSHLTILNFDDLFCDSEVCFMGTPKISYYMDASHLSDDGASRLVPSVSQLLSSRH